MDYFLMFLPDIIRILILLTITHFFVIGLIKLKCIKKSHWYISIPTWFLLMYITAKIIPFIGSVLTMIGTILIFSLFFVMCLIVGNED